MLYDGNQKSLVRWLLTRLASTRAWHRLRAQHHPSGCLWSPHAAGASPALPWSTSGWGRCRSGCPPHRTAAGAEGPSSTSGPSLPAHVAAEQRQQHPQRASVVAVSRAQRSQCQRGEQKGRIQRGSGVSSQQADSLGTQLRCRNCRLTTCSLLSSEIAVLASHATQYAPRAYSYYNAGMQCPLICSREGESFAAKTLKHSASWLTPARR